MILLPRSDGEPVGDLGARLLNLCLLGLSDRVLVSRVRLRDEVVLATPVFHDLRQWLLLPDVQLQAEVLGHEEILPATEAGSAEMDQVLLSQSFLV